MVKLLSHIGNVLMDKVDGLAQRIGSLAKALDGLAELHRVHLQQAGAVVLLAPQLHLDALGPVIELLPCLLLFLQFC